MLGAGVVPSSPAFVDHKPVNDSAGLVGLSLPNCSTGELTCLALPCLALPEPLGCCADCLGMQNGSLVTYDCTDTELSKFWLMEFEQCKRGRAAVCFDRG